MEQDPILKDHQFPPWLGSRLHSLVQLRPSAALEDGRHLLLRAFRSDRLPRIRLLSGLLVEREADDGLVTVTHEWHNTRTRGPGSHGANPHCGLARYILRGEELVEGETSEDLHTASTLFTATTEAGRLNELRSPLFDPVPTERARRTATEVLVEHTFTSPQLVVGLGHVGLQVAPVHA
jgi:hypothetical protein